MRIDQLGKGFQDIDHLVAALAATNVQHDIGIGPARDLLLDHGLAGAERPGHRGLASFQHREEGIQHALPGEQRLA